MNDDPSYRYPSFLPPIYSWSGTGGGDDPVTIRARQYKPSPELMRDSERDYLQRLEDRFNSKNYWRKYGKAHRRANAAREESK